MSTENRSRTLFFAVIVIVAGVLLLLRGIDLIPWEVSRVIISWQMLLIVIGGFNIFSSQHKTSGYILLAIGGFFMLNKFHYFHFNFWQVAWPLILIIVGVAILINYNKRRDDGYKYNYDGEPLPGDADDRADYIDEISIFSGSEKTITSKNFRGGKITSIFGGSELNLTRAELSEGRNELEVLTVFGGTTLIVPPDWEVKVNVTAIFGGISDKRYKYTKDVDQSSKVMFVQGVVLFGGGEIKSY